MNKINFLTIMLVSTFLSCSAQKTQERAIGAFSKIKVSGAISVIYTNSDTLNLTVKARESDLDAIETKVEYSTLIISNKGKSHDELYVYIKNNQLSGIEASGATSFKTTNSLRPDSLLLNLTGASSLKLKVEAKKIKVIGDGASSAYLEGKTDFLHLELTGASTLKSYNLICKDAVLLTSGAATAKVYVTDKLKATASSASDIKIKGDPKEVTVETSTAASVLRIQDGAKNDDKSEGDTTQYSLGKRKIFVVKQSGDGFSISTDENDGFKHWRGFSMAVNGYMNPGGGTSLNRHNQYLDLDYRRSLNFQFNIVERQIDLVKNNMKLVTGFGFDYHLYEMANKTNLDADSSFTWGAIDSTNKYAYKRNKLRCTYLQVPLLLEFNTSNDPDETFHIAIGVIGQFLISSRTKQVLMEGKNETTNVRKDSYNLSPFAAKAHVNLGYKNWTFFGEYSLTSLFQPGKGPELYPFAAGLRVVPFS